MTCTFERPQRRRPRTKTLKGHQEDTQSGGIPTPGNGVQFVMDHGTSAGATSPSTLLKSPTSVHSTKFGIETICSKDILGEIVQDYIRRLYCLTPLVHKPSFWDDLDGGRAEHDPLFFSFVFSLSTWVCSMLPVHFASYKSRSRYFPYDTTSDMVDKCEATVVALRPRDYFENPTNLHCGIAFALFQGFASVGLSGRARTYAAELDTCIKALRANDPESYRHLSFPDQQVRKKLFWLNFFIQTHARLGDQISRHLYWMPVPDTMIFESDLTECLLPLPVDDEFLLPDQILQRPPGENSLTAGYIGIIRIFLCFVAPVAGRIDSRAEQERGGLPDSTRSLRDLVNLQASRDLHDMLYRIHKVADDLPDAFALFKARENSVTPQSDFNDQLGSMRANIQVTRLWARYLIFDRLVSVLEALHGPSVTNRSLIISEHEAICEDLLQFLASVTMRNLESNGVPISFKIRQVAALLLDYSPRSLPTDQSAASPDVSSPEEVRQHRLAERADTLIDKFLALLTQMDSATMQDSQMMLSSLDWPRADTNTA